MSGSRGSSRRSGSGGPARRPSPPSSGHRRAGSGRHAASSHRADQRSGHRGRPDTHRTRATTGVPNRTSVPVPPEVLAGRSSEAAEEAETVATNERRALWLVASRVTVVALLAGVVAGAVAGLVGGGGAAVAAGLAVVVVVGLVGVGLLRWAGSGAVVRSLGARPAGPEELPRLRNLAEGLCATIGVASPDIMVVDHPGANALALARPRRPSVLVVTAGLESSLSVVELEGVLAHELVRVKLHETELAAAALAVTAPLAAVGGRGADRVRSLLGPSRAFRADQRAAAVVRYPPGLAAALERLLVVASSTSPAPAPWERGPIARSTRPLWVDPVGADDVPREGNLDHTAVRAAALALE